MTAVDEAMTVDEARRQGAAEGRRSALRVFAGVTSAIVLLLLGTFAAGYVLAERAREAAPHVIEQIASERRGELEARMTARGTEARALAGDLFVFLQRLWQENEALERVRTNVEAATTQLRILRVEVNAAYDSPTNNLGALMRNGPTRASAVLDYSVAIANELQRLVPLVLRALGQAKTAAEAEPDGPALPAMLDAMDALLAPFIGTNAALETEWQTVKTGLLDWARRVGADLDHARAQLSGDDLSDEFFRRLRVRVL